MAKVSKMQARVNGMKFTEVSSKTLREKLGLVDIELSTAAEEVSNLSKSTALLQETENAYALFGILQKLNDAFYQTSHRPTAAKLLKEMMRVAEESGASESLTLEWANYQYRRWMASN